MTSKSCSEIRSSDTTNKAKGWGVPSVLIRSGLGFSWGKFCRRFAAGYVERATDPRLAKPRPGLNSDRCFAARFNDYFHGLSQLRQWLLTCKVKTNGGGLTLPHS